MQQITTAQRRTLGILAGGDEWQARFTVQQSLGRSVPALDEVLALGLAEQRSERRGQRGRLRREVRITRDGMMAWTGAVPSPDDVVEP